MVGNIIILETVSDDGFKSKFKRRIREVIPLDNGRVGLVNESVVATNLDGSHDRLGDIILEPDGVTCQEIYHLNSKNDYLRSCRLIGVHLG